MRQKRAKTYRKLMALYSMSFGFRQPYQTLIDSEMCKAATDSKIELLKQLTAVVQGQVKPMITQCCIHELYLQGKTQQPAVDLAKTFERRMCNHREPITGDDCLLSVVGDKNKHRYVIATQSHPLRVKLRSVPAVPIVHINRTVMVLEPPSDVTMKAKEDAEQQALHASAPDIALGSTSTSEPAPKKKKKGPKGPNPLSVKKKVPKTSPPNPENSKRRDIEPAREEAPQAKAGEKRKQVTEEAGEDHVSGNEEHEGERSRPRKRKRRRTKAAADTAEADGNP